MDGAHLNLRKRAAADSVERQRTSAESRRRSRRSPTAGQPAAGGGLRHRKERRADGRDAISFWILREWTGDSIAQWILRSLFHKGRIVETVVERRSAVQ